MENHCPDCGSDLIWDDGIYRCTKCEKCFLKQMFCLVCESQLEKLQACGSTSYFCHTCNELKSKSSAGIVFEQQKTVS